MIYCLYGSHIYFLNCKEFQENKHSTGKDSFRLTSSFLLVFVNSLLQIGINTVHMNVNYCIVWKSDMTAVLTSEK